MYQIVYLVFSEFFKQVMANNLKLKTKFKIITDLGFFDDGRLNRWLVLNMIV